MAVITKSLRATTYATPHRPCTPARAQADGNKQAGAIQTARASQIMMQVVASGLKTDDRDTAPAQ